MNAKEECNQIIKDLQQRLASLEALVAKPGLSGMSDDEILIRPNDIVLTGDVTIGDIIAAQLVRNGFDPHRDSDVDLMAMSGPVIGPIKIEIDISQIKREFDPISSVFPKSFKGIPKRFHDLLFSLSQGLLPDDCIACTGSATVAGHHVIRFGVVGDLKELGIALGALKAD